MNTKVLYDYQAFSQIVGGVSRYHVELLTHLSEYAIEPILPCIFTENIYIREAFIKHRSIPTWLPGRYKPYVAAWLNQQICKKAVEKSDYDIFHATFVNPYYEKSIKNKPVVVTVHDLIQEKTQRSDAALTSQRRLKQLQHASAIICVSHQTKDDLLYFYPQIPEDKISVIYHGNDQIQPDNVGARIYDFPYLLYVGSREKYKNFDNMLKAFAQLPKDLRLICTGSQFSNEEQRIIRELNLSGRIIQKFVSDYEMMNLFHYAEAFVYPSTMEGFGIPILEAFRLGCPVVLSDIKCFREVGGDYIAYFDPFSADSISTVISSVINNNDKRNSLIDYGYERLKLFSWEKSIKKHVELYNGLI